MIRLTTGRAALFGAMLLVALIVFLPMRLVLGAVGAGDAGFAARHADGSVWAGSLSEASAAGLQLGDLSAALSPVQLFAGRARVNLASRESVAAHTFRGALGLSRHNVGADDVTATLPAGALFAPLPVTALDLDDVSVRFKDGLCDHAEGRVRALLAGDVAGVALTGGLAGDARCDAGALPLPLASQAGTERAELRITADGRYTARLAMAAADPATAAKLSTLRFQPGAGGHQLSVQGRF